jgi:hypothetical protein
VAILLTLRKLAHQKLWQLKNDPTHEQLVTPIDCGYQLGGGSNRGYGSYPGSENP